MSIESWAELWKYTLLVGCGAFFLLALAIVPLGLRDVLRLFRKLGAPEPPPPGGGERPPDAEK